MKLGVYLGSLGNHLKDVKSYMDTFIIVCQGFQFRLSKASLAHKLTQSPSYRHSPKEDTWAYLLPDDRHQDRHP